MMSGLSLLTLDVMLDLDGKMLDITSLVVLMCGPSITNSAWQHLFLGFAIAGSNSFGLGHLALVSKNQVANGLQGLTCIPQAADLKRKFVHIAYTI